MHYGMRYVGGERCVADADHQPVRDAQVVRDDAQNLWLLCAFRQTRQYRCGCATFNEDRHGYMFFEHLRHARRRV